MDDDTIQWISLEDGSYCVFHDNCWWKLTVEFTGVGYERTYWLDKLEGDRFKIRTKGGLFTALDIAMAFITGMSLDDVEKMY